MSGGFIACVGPHNQFLLPIKDRVPQNVIGPASSDMTGKHSNPLKRLFTG